MSTLLGCDTFYIFFIISLFKKIHVIPSHEYRSADELTLEISGKIEE